MRIERSGMVRKESRPGQHIGSASKATRKGTNARKKKGNKKGKARRERNKWAMSPRKTRRKQKTTK